MPVSEPIARAGVAKNVEVRGGQKLTSVMLFSVSLRFTLWRQFTFFEYAGVGRDYGKSLEPVAVHVDKLNPAKPITSLNAMMSIAFAPPILWAVQSGVRGKAPHFAWLMRAALATGRLDAGQ
jgi:hypothetical protein